MMYLGSPKKQMYFPENILTERKNEYSFFLKKELLEILWAKVNMYPLYLIESYYNSSIDESLKGIFNLDNAVKNMFDKDNIIFLLNYYKDGEGYYYLFVGNEISNDNNFLNRYKINDSDLEFVNSVITETKDKHSILIFKEGFFVSFNGIGHYWLSPIEYYLKWKNEMEGKEIFNRELLKGPYDFISKKVNDDVKKELNELGYEGFFISNKEKFGSWRYEKSYVIKKVDKEVSIFKKIYNFITFNNEYDTKYISISGIKDTGVYYKIYYLFDKYMNEYKNINPLTAFDYEEEWKNSFGIEI